MQYLPYAHQEFGAMSKYQIHSHFHNKEFEHKNPTQHQWLYNRN